jgi:hypothetical protein
VTWSKAKLGRTKPIARYNRSADGCHRSYCRKVLRQESGFASAGTDVREAEGSRRYGRKAQGGPENLAAAFAMRTVEAENIHWVRPPRS